MSLEARIKAALAAIGQDVKALLGRAPPAGGDAGQVLVKISAADHAMAWATPAAGGGSALVRTVTVDFGAAGAISASFDVSAPGVAAGQAVAACVSGDAPPGGFPEDFAFNPFVLQASCPAAGLVRITAASPSGFALFGPHAVTLVTG
jgi:hypothetical protein